MRKSNYTIIVSLCCIVFFAAFANAFPGNFPDICIPGSCGGELRDGSGVLKGSFSNWVFLADATSTGQWSYNDPVYGIVQSTNAEGDYIFDPVTVSATATYTGNANFPAHPEYGSSSYTMQLALTFPSGGYCDGTWSIDFGNGGWPDPSGTWHHTSRYSSPVVSHVYDIYIDTLFDFYDVYDANNFSCEFTIEFETDDTVDLIRVTTSGTPPSVSGITFDIPKLAHQWDDINRIGTNYEYDPVDDIYNWEYYKDADLMSDLDEYGNGWYDIIVFYAGGGSDNTRVWFGVPAENTPVPQPTQKANLTSPLNHQRLQSPVTFQWDPCTDPKATTAYLGLERLAIFEDIEVDLPVNQTSYGPVGMKDGFWEICLSFDNWYDVPHNADGVPYDIGRYHESYYRIGVGVLAEITGDDIVNLEDFAKFAAGWLDTDCYDYNNYCNRADINFDTNVNFDDLLIICQDWLDQPVNP